MSTGIQWTDETWNAITGCKQVSPGCAHCYAKVEHDRRHKAHQAGKAVAPQYAEPFEVVQLHPDRLDAPLRRRKPSRYFVTSGADPFHEDVPDVFLDCLFAVMAMASRHTFQLLTKRPLRARDYLSSERRLDRIHTAIAAMQQGVGRRLAHADHVAGRWPLRNLWLGVSVENQRWADERIPLLRETPAAVRFISAEPLLGPLELTPYLEGEEEHGVAHTVGACVGWTPPIDWVIVGGESGAGARPCDVHWIADILAQCDFAGVPAFVKQLGALPGFKPEDECARGNLTPSFHHYDAPSGLHIKKMGDRHGSIMAEWPAELRVREFPEVRAHA
jgi:protein gp37